MVIPTATTPMKTAMSLGFKTFRRMTISGKEMAMIDIMKASVVPRAAPFPMRASTMGITPAALEYHGIPNRTTAGTDHQALPMYLAIMPAGI